jgi:hypothetical protein
MRARAAVEGAAKSVGSTGSQIAKTRTFWLLISRSNCPVAEAPCKQTAQVGDSITTTRIEDAEALNAVFKGVRSPAEKLIKGGCPLGVECPP